jgi:hypothetical protein
LLWLATFHAASGDARSWMLDRRIAIFPIPLGDSSRGQDKWHLQLKKSR